MGEFQDSFLNSVHILSYFNIDYLVPDFFFFSDGITGNFKFKGTNTGPCGFTGLLFSSLLQNHKILCFMLYLVLVLNCSCI